MHTEAVTHQRQMNAAAGTMTSQFPPRLAVVGVGISRTDYDEACGAILAAAAARQPVLVTALAVHGTMEAVRDRAFGAQIERFDLVVPDGQPIRWALRLAHGVSLPDRVYGPELMMRLCSRAREAGISVYLYGSTLDTVTRLKVSLQRSVPGLAIVGCEPSLFRPLTSAEDRELVERIERSGAGIVFIGLGCPRQERFAFAHRETIRAVQVCVGAAFDFHAGTKRQAPRWMQDRGLEWLFRLCQEPRRLWRRYAVTNSLFLCHLAKQLLSKELPSFSRSAKSDCQV